MLVLNKQQALKMLDHAFLHAPVKNMSQKSQDLTGATDRNSKGLSLALDEVICV